MKKPFFSPPLTGRHVLLILILFFGVVFAVNGIFIYQAERTWRGLQSKTAYEDGLAYNRTLAEAKVQKARGFQPTLTLTRTELSLRLLDRNGAPVTGLAPMASVGRPADEAYDQRLALTPQGPGLYSAKLALPFAGQWQVQVNIPMPDGHPYRLEERVVLP